MLDILIKNANVVDGTGENAYKAHVGIKNNKIAMVLKSTFTDAKNNYDAVSDIESLEVIDADGLTLSPGFIDVHGHSDLFAFIDPNRSSKLAQGITTEIVGQCGLGPAPASMEFFSQYVAYFKKQGAPIYPDAQAFTTFENYLNRMEQTEMGINLAYFVPHGTVRMAAMGLSPEVPNSEQLEKMKFYVENAMRSGALGLSSGLMYSPGSYANQQEIQTLCKVVGQYGGIYTSHIRDQGNHLEECIAETIEVGERTGSRINISHHKATGKSNWGKIKKTCKMIHDAKIPTTHDVYPYTASSTVISSTLPPHYLKMEQEALLNHISANENRLAFYNAIYHPTELFNNPLETCGYDGILIINASVTHDAIGMTIAEYALYLGIEPFSAYIKLLTDNKFAVTYVGFSMSEEDVEMLIKDPLCMYGTDGLYVPGMNMTHPRAIGTFPKILSTYVRNKKLISLEEAIRKMTGYPASIYGFKSKGLIKEGYDADLVIFDAERIQDYADFKTPLVPNKGISRVYVNGKLALKDDKSTGLNNGTLLRG